MILMEEVHLVAKNVYLMKWYERLNGIIIDQVR